MVELLVLSPIETLPVFRVSCVGMACREDMLCELSGAAHCEKWGLLGIGQV